MPFGQQLVDQINLDHNIWMFAQRRSVTGGGVKVNGGKFGDLLAVVKAVAYGKDEK